MVKVVKMNEDLEVRGSLRDYEEAIRQIREVMAVRVVAGPRGDIDEIHVLAGNGRAPKQIVRDIESSLMAQYGLPVDHKKISVAQIEETSPVAWGTGRLKLLAVRFTTDGGRAEAEVRVEFDNIIHSGHVTGPSSSNGRLRVLAEATLAAVNEYFDSNLQLALDDVCTLDVHGRIIIVSVVSMLAHGAEETLVGSCLVRGNEADAVTRSVLDALNRRFVMIVRKPGAREGASGSEEKVRSDGQENQAP